MTAQRPANGEFGITVAFALWLIAACCGCSVHRIVHRFGEMLIGHLQVVLRGDRLRVPDPLANDMHGELLGEFRFPSGSKIREEFRPRGRPRSRGYAGELGPKIRTGIAVAGDNVFGSRFGFREAVAQVRVQLREDRDVADTAIGVVFGL